jgi:hypothetical protein
MIRYRLKNDVNKMSISKTEAMQFAEAVRSMLALETTLVSQSINWMLVVQGFLFGAVAQLHEEHKFILVFGLVGLSIPTIFLHSFKTSERAIAEILVRWNAFKNSLSDEERFFLPPVFAGGKVELRTIDRLITPRFALPWLFIVSWGCILINSLH